MADGPGKYNDWCTAVREGTQADGVVLIVLNGVHGNGFAVEAAEQPLHPVELANLLQRIVDQLRREENLQ